MIYMNQVVSDVVTWAVSAGIGSLGVYVTHKGLLGKVAQFIVEHGKQIEHPTVTLVQEALDTPVAKAAEIHLKEQLDKALADVQKTTVGQLAAQALAAGGKRLENLTKEQVDAVAIQIATMLPRDWRVSKQFITDALTEAQKAVDAIAAAPVVEAAARFAAEVAAAQQRATTDSKI
jgi:hypothetical protein